MTASIAMTVHFRPPGGYVGDLIPFERGGRIWLFYLLDERRDPPTGMPWALASTDDFVSYTDHGVVLPSGGPDAADYDCYTGCVIDDGDQLHLFYTGPQPGTPHHGGRSPGGLSRNERRRPHPVATHPDHTFGAPTGYLPEDWRDPYVYRVTPDEPWQLVLAARHTGGPDRRCGVVARLTSTDLATWHLTTPLWDPHRFITQECPEVFRWGDWWYLVYSEFSDAFQTRYRIAAGPDGPWLAPECDSVDGRARYASKSVARGDRRFFVGWIATRAGESRRRRLGMGRRARRARGNPGDRRHPGVRAPSRTRGQSSPSQKRSSLVQVDGAAADPGTGATDRFAAWLGPTLPDPCLVTATLDIPPGTQACGLLLRTDDDRRDRLRSCGWSRAATESCSTAGRGAAPGRRSGRREGTFPTRSSSNAPVPYRRGSHTVQVLIDGSSCVAVVDNRVALSTRLYDHRSGRVGLFVSDGQIGLEELHVAVRP